ncbi:MAG: AIPR family protein [Bryobacteraceae bacterium]
MNFVIDWRSAQDIAAMVHRADKTHAHKFGLTDMVKREGPRGETILLGFVPLVHVLKCYREMGSRFLERNIRFGLGNRKYVNQVLRSAFRAVVSQGEDAASLFVFHHNGITLAAENVEKSDGELVLTEPRLLNGAQTITTFREFSDELEATAQTEAVSNALEKLMVPCKIIVGCKADFVTAVTINNNRQTPVEPWQLRANDEIQISLQDKFRRDLGLYYERQAGAFQALDEKTKRDLGLIESKRAIELRKLAQTFLVAEGRLSRAHHLREVFQQDEQYRQVFHEGRLKADSKSIVLCYKTHFRLRQISRMLAEEARKYEFAPKVQPLIWALLCQALLNAENLERLQENYGCDLVVQDEFVDTLSYLGRKLVKPLISDVLTENGRPVSQDEEGAEFVRNLNSDQTFRKCMKYAEARWGWRTRKLE